MRLWSSEGLDGYFLLRDVQLFMIQKEGLNGHSMHVGVIHNDDDTELMKPLGSLESTLLFLQTYQGLLSWCRPFEDD